MSERVSKFFVESQIKYFSRYAPEKIEVSINDFSVVAFENYFNNKYKSSLRAKPNHVVSTIHIAKVINILIIIKKLYTI